MPYGPRSGAVLDLRQAYGTHRRLDPGGNRNKGRRESYDWEPWTFLRLSVFVGSSQLREPLSCGGCRRPHE